MTDILTLSQHHNLKVHRCFDCGRFYAFETFGPSYPPCPVCAQETNRKLADRIVHLERSNRSLRGAATRRKRRKTDGR